LSGRIAPLLGALFVAVVLAGIVIATQNGGGASFTSHATAICQDTQRALQAGKNTSPTSIAQGLQIEHTLLAVYTREITQLERLRPPAAITPQFHAGLADDQALLAGLRSMLARPDFVELSLTLPGHPELMPAWLKAWLALGAAV
jgi:hypothetical protein